MNRTVWWAGRSVTFHPSKTNAHRGFVYRAGRRKYGTITLTGLGWSFTTHAATEAANGYNPSLAVVG